MNWNTRSYIHCGDMRTACYSSFASVCAGIILTTATSAFSQSYDPPIGIPAPEFGIQETVESVYGLNSIIKFNNF